MYMEGEERREGEREREKKRERERERERERCTCSTVTAIGKPCLFQSCVMPSLMATRPVLRDRGFHFLASNVFGTISFTASFTLSPLTEDTAADSADGGKLSSFSGEAWIAVLVVDQRGQEGERVHVYEVGVLADSSKPGAVLREFSIRKQSLQSLIRAARNDIVHVASSLVKFFIHVGTVSNRSAPVHPALYCTDSGSSARVQ